MSIFFENRGPDQFDNEIPSRRVQASAPTFWNFMGPLLGGGGHTERPNARIEALRKNAAGYDQQRQPSLVREIVDEAAYHLVQMLPDALRPIKASALDAAVSWLTTTLAAGQLPANEVKRLAALEGIRPRTLVRAAKRAKVKSVKCKDKSWAWRLVQPKTTGGKV